MSGGKSKTISSPPLPSIIALLPIKGESERVPGKNLRNFSGKPLLCRVLRTLQETDAVSRVVVNTDSARVTNCVRDFSKTVVHERPPRLCGHTVPMNDIIAYDLGLLGPGHYLQTHVTNPLLKSETITNAVAAYFDGLPSHDSLFSVVRRQSRFFDADMRPINHDPAVLLNTQDLPPVYEENSCLYIFSDKSFFANGKNRIGGKYQTYPMSHIESLDIDTEEDFRLAEIAWQAFREPDAA
jgi:CMP-N-acetylneuraminic acid synthetase